MKKQKQYIHVSLTTKQVEAAMDRLKVRRNVQWDVRPTWPGQAKFEGTNVCRVTEDRNHESAYRNGRWKTTQSASHIIRVVSYAEISSPGKTCTIYTICPIKAETVKTRYVMPAGYKYAVDNMGLKVVRVVDGRDYHAPSNYHMHLRPDYLIAELCKLDSIRDLEAAQKAEQQASEAAFLRDIETTRVTLHDSRMAGNCVSGSLTFARLNLGRGAESVVPLNSPPVKASVLLRTGDNRAINAAHKAWQRETLVCI